ncbi:carboxypeptidase regulatory-like domain-containing protein [Granulicella sp. S190]|uniref:carboxypeptidase regulatory-like domain-containing protein n=1 Tax=Granulicella sp. S190 TaxID=1747226 RepID=UPI00131CF9E3|nr:carboxypeptidase regulatory-like domain-containing protein [Granulicella sp. S190]
MLNPVSLNEAGLNKASVNQVGSTVSQILKAFCLVIILCGSLVWASVAGSISGTVKDPSGRVVSNAEIILHETSTGLSYHATANSKGYYTLPVLPVGRYELEAQSTGFRSYQRKDIVLDTNAALTIDVALELGSVKETISVTDNTLHVETISTQLGEVITGRQMTAVPLNGRSFTDLLSLQAGVAPATSITNSTVQDVGATILNPSGTLNPGTVSVNGQNEFSNFFTVNGSDVEEDVNGGTAIIPNLDAIAEFRIVTSNFDAEYGEFSGGQISVITKSGTNAFHGSAFEFLRNTDLDARNYFSPTRGAFRQNQFGGTFGGPVHKDKAFFFIDYQGTRQTMGVDTGNIGVPSVADRTGNLLDFTNGTAGNQLGGAVGGPYFANLLSQKLGYPVVQGEPYYVPGCTSSAQCVFPNANIPQSVWSTPAQKLLQYIPAPNTALGTYATSSFNQKVRDDKAGARFDVTTRLGLISAYYFIDDFNLDNPYPVAQSGASVPGFDAITTGRAQLFSLGDTKTLNATSVNELHVSFMRNLTNLGQPVGGKGVSLASQGFVNADGSPSIVALDPKGESVENLNFNGYSTGAAANQLIQANNTYQVTDVFSKVLGRHTLKFGGEFHADQVNGAPIAQFNGNFVFQGTETGVDFADFLIGVPTQYNQSQLNPFYARNKYAGLFAQDSFHLLPNLTLNYGVRWDRVTPWSERYNQISTFVAGAQSTVFPGAPPGILYPGDPGIPDTLAPISNRHFAPRVGLAWSPQSDSGALEKILGAPGATSIRASYGNFYTAIPALSIGVLAANAPYGTTYSSPQSPLFATPFVNAADGQNNGQPFPYTFAPLNSSRSNPDPNINWSAFQPIEGIPGYDIHNRIPYTEEWSLSIERQLGPNTVLSASYIGNSSHHQLVLIEPNAGSPSTCLSLSLPSEVQPGTLTCGPGGEDTVYFPIGGGQVNGTRGPLGPNFGSNALQSTIGHASYNALELGARHTSGRLEFAVAYTYGKSLDQSSNLGEEVNPTNPSLSYAVSAFDVKHNVVVSYEYQLPFDQFLRPNRLTSGWSLSGISHFATGFPITLINNSDNSLLGTNPNGINNSAIDEPDYSGGSLHLNHNPRNGNGYFDTTAFTQNALGTPGTAKRRFFYGPGTDNYDMAVAKRLPLTEAKSLLFRVEAFNVFNHTQFSGPSSVDGNIGSTTFGTAVSAAPARVLQGAAKFNF